MHGGLPGEGVLNLRFDGYISSIVVALLNCLACSGLVYCLYSTWAALSSTGKAPFSTEEQIHNTRLCLTVRNPWAPGQVHFCGSPSLIVRNTQYNGPKLPLRSLTSLGFAEFSVSCLKNLSHSHARVHRQGKEISAFVIMLTAVIRTRLKNLTIWCPRRWASDEELNFVEIMNS